ncbi:MAG: twin-arginine translocase subunit TatC [Bacteroidales bacterium]|nr:twin-arginine translocase subunit TatC [Bacteroidales bacterium]MBD5363191.1 twin-arginine translocase subunit TatC [Bacteroides sp.]MBD5364514.1 twin-arginine translocase subunit TatC [Bacteroides sp.]
MSIKESEQPSEVGLLTFGEHLEILRKMLFRIIAVVIVLAVIIFCFKKETFAILLAPQHYDFCTFKLIEHYMHVLGWDFHFTRYSIPLISTELSAQFMTHITISCVLAILLASPYIVFELFRFISPALYESEKKYSYAVAVVIYALFLIGLLMSYYILFPISFRFLATYQVDESIVSTITLDSYISTFITLTFLMGVVFQLPVFAYILEKMGFIDADLLRKYRPYAFVIIMIIAAIITPPDIFTLIMVTFPIYGLYEASILVLRRTES